MFSSNARFAALRNTPLRTQGMWQRRSLHPMQAQVHSQPLDRLNAGVEATSSETAVRHDLAETGKSERCQPQRENSSRPKAP